MSKLKLLTDIEESYTELRYKTSWPTGPAGQERSHRADSFHHYSGDCLRYGSGGQYHYALHLQPRSVIFKRKKINGGRIEKSLVCASRYLRQGS